MGAEAFRMYTAKFDDAPALLYIFQQYDHFSARADHCNSITLVDVMDWLESTTE